MCCITNSHGRGSQLYETEYLEHFVKNLDPEQLPQLVMILNKYTDSVFIQWNIEDVFLVAESLNIVIDKPKAIEILKMVEENHDPYDGITYDVIKSALEML